MSISKLRYTAVPITLIAVIAVAVMSQASATAAIRAKPVVGGLEMPVGFTLGPGNKIWFVEKTTGVVGVYDRDSGRVRRFHRFADVSSEGERGTLGIALHPDYPSTPHVFVYVTRDLGASGIQNQIVRLTNVDGRGGNRTVIWSAPTTTRTNHNGGHIAFGPDGMLYAVVGEGGVDPATAQDLGDDRGKVLRMEPDGDPPADNPDPLTRVFSYGLRNSFGFAFDPQTGNLWETENGPECNDELNRIVAGGNYAWGANETCSGVDPGNTNQDAPMPRILPQRWYTPTIVPTGIVFCDGCRLGPGYEGRFLFGTASRGIVRRVRLDASRDTIVAVDNVFNHPGRVFSMEAGPGGTIFFSDDTGIRRLFLPRQRSQGA